MDPVGPSIMRQRQRIIRSQSFNDAARGYQAPLTLLTRPLGSSGVLTGSTTAALRLDGDDTATSAVDAAQSLIEVQNSLSRLIDKALQGRHRVDSEKQTLQNCLRFVLESAEEYQAALKQHRQSGSIEDSLGLLDPLYERLKSDYDAFTKQEQVTRTQQDELSNVEFLLLSKEEESSRSIQDFLSAMGKDVPPAALDQSPSFTPEQTPSELPTVLEQFYHYKGEIGIQRERLQGLNDDYYEELADRDFREDHGEILVPTDEEFEQRYRRKRRQILDDSRVARQETKRLFEECRAAGLEIEGTADHEIYGEDDEDPAIRSDGLLDDFEFELIQLPQPFLPIDTSALVPEVSPEVPGFIPTRFTDPPAILSTASKQSSTIPKSGSEVNVGQLSADTVSVDTEDTHQSVRLWLAEMPPEVPPPQGTEDLNDEPGELT